jgi:hypothetical protein
VPVWHRTSSPVDSTTCSRYPVATLPGNAQGCLPKPQHHRPSKKTVYWHGPCPSSVDRHGPCPLHFCAFSGILTRSTALSSARRRAVQTAVSDLLQGKSRSTMHGLSLPGPF